MNGHPVDQSGASYRVVGLKITKNCFELTKTNQNLTNTTEHIYHRIGGSELSLASKCFADESAKTTTPAAPAPPPPIPSPRRATSLLTGNANATPSLSVSGQLICYIAYQINSVYSVTIHVVTNLPLTSKQIFQFSIWASY